MGEILLHAAKKTCIICGNPLITGDKCCSLRCRGILRTRTAKDKYRGASCVHCGKPLTSLQACKRHKYCSHICYTNHTRKKLHYTNCLFCGKPINKDKQINGAKFCSFSCSQKEHWKKHDYGYDVTFGSDPNEERFAYFLGLWVADGAISKNKQISLKLIDEQIINDVAKSIKYTRPIRTRTRQLTTWNKQYELTFSGPIADKLISYGYTLGAKTGKEFIPECINNNNILHFTRGLIDGDGNLNIQTIRGRKYLTTTIFIANKECLMDLKHRLKNMKIIGNGSIYKNHNIYNLKFSHYDSLSLCLNMYKNASIFLNRKYTIFKSCPLTVIRYPKWVGGNNGFLQNS